MTYPNTRKKALIDCSEFYFTGKECIRGHVSKRRTKSKVCVECSREDARSQYNEKKEECLARNKRWREENKGARSEYMREYRKNNAESIKKAQADYYEKNKSSIYLNKKEYHKTWIEKNKDHINGYKREYIRSWSKTREGKSIRFMRMSVYRALNGSQKDDKTEDILGYTRHELVSHIEKQFTKGMSWDNYGTKWHIDHITPIKFFIENGVNDPSVVNCLSNLRPVCAKENLSKGARMEHLI